MSCGRLLAVACAASLLASGCAADLGLDRARAYPCAGDAGEGGVCAPGWRCGLDALCHSEDAGAAYLCHTDSDCEQGWRCGLSGTCHDRIPAAYACASSADCEGGWRCGLEGLCHDPAVAAAYLCQADPDCEQGWRCAPTGTCVDARPDALRVEASAGHLSHARLSPQLIVSQPDQIAFDVGVGNFRAQSIDLVRGGVLTHVEHDPAWLLLPDGGRALVASASVPVGGLGVQTVVNHGRTSYLLRDGGIDRFIFDFDGGTYAPLSSVTGEQLRVIDGSRNLYLTQPDQLIVLGDRSLAVVDTASGASLTIPPTITASDGGAQQIHDALGFARDPGNGIEGFILAAAEEGMYLARADAGVFTPWEPFDLPGVPNGSCGTSLASGLEVVRISALYANEIGLEARSRSDAGTERYGLLFTPGGVSGSACPWTMPNPSLTLEAGACTLCPPGETLVDVGLVDSESFNARCREKLPGGSSREHVDFTRPGGLTDGGCYRSSTSAGELPTTLFEDAVLLPGPPFREEGDGLGLGRYGIGFGHAGQHGTLWRESPLGGGDLPLTLDVTPDAVTGSGNGLLAVARGYYGNGVARWVPGIGLVTENTLGGVADLVTGVDGKPNWAVFSRTSSLGGHALQVWTKPEGGSLIATSALIPMALSGPFTAVATTLPDGGTELLVSAFDALMAADVTPALQGGPSVSLEVKDVPNPGSEILSLTALDPVPPTDAGAPLVFGYALTPNRLMAFRELSASRWRSDEVPVPVGEWRKVWADGPRGRLGYVDGRVVSLPSMVRISDPLPSARAADYGQLCGEAFALATDNLYRLVAPADGGVIGEWTREDIVPQLPPADLALDAGRLYTAGYELDVFTHFGTVVRLQSGGCP